MDDIAKAAGITKAVIYDHFPSKHDLLVATVEEHQTALLERMGAALAGADDAVTRLEQTTAAFLAFVEDRPFVFQILVGEPGAPEVTAVYAHAQQVISDAIAALLTAEPVARPDDPDRDVRVQILAQLVRVTVSGAAMWWRDHRDLDRTFVGTVMLEFMWFGLSGLREGRRWAG
jgi:AcrR family transcriptional regulator